MTDDQGLQPERTAIAWTRTALSFAANGVLLIPRYLHDRTDPIALAFVAIAFGAAVVTSIEALRRRRQLGIARHPGPVPVHSLAVIACGVVVLGLLLILDAILI